MKQLKKNYCEAEEEEMMEKAKLLLEKGGLSGGTIDFLEHLIWHGFALDVETAYFQYQRMRKILGLYPEIR